MRTSIVCAVILCGLTLLNSTTRSIAVAASASDDPAHRAAYLAYLDFGDLVRGGRVTPNWMPDGPSFWYAEGGPQDRNIHKINPATNRKEPIFDVARLRQALTEKLGYEPAGRGVPFAELRFVNPKEVEFNLESKTWRLNLDDYQLQRRRQPAAFDSWPLLPSEHERVTPRSFLKDSFNSLGVRRVPESASPDGRWFASVMNGNIALRATLDGQTMMLTDDGEPECYWDVETQKWNPWSPDGQKLAVFKIDISGMARIPTIHWLTPLEQAGEVIGVPAGGKINRNELYVLNLSRGKPIRADLGDTSDQHLVVLGWLPDSARLMLARYDRLLTKVDIMVVDTMTGAVRVVMTEQSKTFLTNYHASIWGADTGFTLLPDGSGFIWRSERDGWAHLYRYDLDGTLVARLTRGQFPVSSVVRVDQKNGWIYLYAHGDQSRPYDTHLYRVSPTGTAFGQLTDGQGQHDVQLAPSSEYFVDTYSTVDQPPQTVLRKSDGTLLQTLDKADISRLQRVGWVPPKEYVVKAADGQTDLWVTMYFPYDFDPGRKYPVVEYIYGGAMAAIRPRDFAVPPPGAGGAYQDLLNFNRALANMGFLIVILDGRGTPERSKAFHDQVYRNWGTYEIADHAGALRQLGSRLSFMDLDRVGVMGASAGGHYSFRALTQAADLYRVGISEVPGFDSRKFTFHEVYLGMPQQNKTAYDTAEVFHLAPKLRGKLLMIGGINDTATMNDLFRMSEILIRLGIQHEVMIYPNSGHGALGKTSEYNLELRKNFLIRHLKP